MLASKDELIDERANSQLLPEESCARLWQKIQINSEHEVGFYANQTSSDVIDDGGTLRCKAEDSTNARQDAGSLVWFGETQDVQNA